MKTKNHWKIVLKPRGEGGWDGTTDNAGFPSLFTWVNINALARDTNVTRHIPDGFLRPRPSL